MEHGETAEELLLLRREQVVAPRDGTVHRLLSLGTIDRNVAQQRQAPFEPSGQCVWRKQKETRRGKFDR